MADAVRMMSGFALQGAIEDVVIPAFRAQSNAGVDATWSPTSLVMKTLAEGGETDVVVLADEAIDELAKGDVVDPASREDLANAILGIAVLKGQPKPDIATKEAFRRTLLDCRSIAYSKAGASGIYFEKLIERLDIADAVKKKAVVIPSGLTAERLVSGEADIAIQQISELVMVEGIDVVGPLPDEIGCVTGFAAAILRKSPRPALAAEFVRMLAGGAAMEAYAAAGLTPRQPQR